MGFDPGAKDPNAIPSDEHTFTFNSPNSWAPAAYDAKLDLVYLPMGVTTPDIWGGNRTPEQERYASSILALNATTGKLAWSYQTVHHDLWDMDLPAQPTLADITVNGQKVPVIYAPAKTGNIFVLDRRNGELVVPAPENRFPRCCQRRLRDPYSTLLGTELPSDERFERCGYVGCHHV